MCRCTQPAETLASIKQKVFLGCSQPQLLPIRSDTLMVFLLSSTHQLPSSIAPKAQLVRICRIREVDCPLPELCHLVVTKLLLGRRRANYMQTFFLTTGANRLRVHAFARHVPLLNRQHVVRANRNILAGWLKWAYWGACDRVGYRFPTNHKITRLTAEVDAVH